MAPGSLSVSAASSVRQDRGKWSSPVLAGFWLVLRAGTLSGLSERQLRWTTVDCFFFNPHPRMCLLILERERKRERERGNYQCACVCVRERNLDVRGKHRLIASFTCPD